MPTNEALALRVREGDSAATEQLWNQIKRYAYTIVRRYGTTTTVDFDDLMQTAYFGMLRAASIYDGEHAFLPILSYAIRNTCRRLYSGHCVEAEASLDAPLGDEESFTLHDALADESIPEVTEAIEQGLRFAPVGMMTFMPPAAVEAPSAEDDENISAALDFADSF